MKLGEFYAEQQLYPASVAAYRAAFAILAKDPNARAEIVAEQVVPFLAAASALAAQDAAQKPALDADMFRAAQLAASDLSDRTIARVAARKAAGDPALSALVRDLEQAEAARDNARLELAAENSKADDERSPALLAKYAADLKSASDNADALAAKVSSGYPGYARLADPGPVALADFQKHLKPGEAFLAFVIGTRSSYALVVTPSGFAAAPLAATEDGLAADVAGLRAAFAPKLGKLPAFSLKSSYALYQQLVGPVAPALATAHRLIVAPSGALSSLPFALLVASEPRGGYADADWLVKRFAIAQVPSPRALVALRDERAAPAPKPFFGVGDPAFSGTTGAKALTALAASCQEGAAADPALLRALPPLPDTAGEVAAAGRALGASSAAILTGAGATETAVRNAGLDRYAVLYFATHGLLPGELHCQAEPGLVLSPPAAPAAPASDGLLSASEIANLKLNADLVVLSACNTAAEGGTKFGGGALEGLADAFFDAGARAVLASHWQVPSAATAKLMTAVFARYGKDRDLAEDLRAAQLSQIATGAHPFDWAAFTLIGDSAGTTLVAKGGE
jgi:CHAT domain-containing protein